MDYSSISGTLAATPMFVSISGLLQRNLNDIKKLDNECELHPSCFIHTVDGILISLKFDTRMLETERLLICLPEPNAVIE